GEWTIDPMHSSLGFAIDHVGISKVYGRFSEFAGSLFDDEKDVSKARVAFTVQAGSIDTAVPPRDTHLRGPDFFDVARYPEIKFESTKVERRAPGYRVTGNLTMHGVTRPVTIPLKLTGPVRDNFGAVRRGFASVNFSIDRRDYGVSWQQMLPGGGKTLGERVEIAITMEATPAKPGELKPAEPPVPAVTPPSGTDGTVVPPPRR
ncbi:polyisoprenoid-binding protein, partial [bacterium]